MNHNKKAMAMAIALLMMLSGSMLMLIPAEEQDAASVEYRLYGCGRNSYGQLGNGTNSNVNTPTQIGAELGNIENVVNTQSTTFFITEDGKLYGCGWNSYGQLGNGTNTNSKVPVQIGADLGKITQVKAATLNTYFITEDGKLYGCGINTSGQLGDGTTTNSNVPVQIGADLGKITFCDASASRIIFITEDGKLYGCGSSEYYQLGAYSRDGFTTPRLIVDNINNVVDVDAGTYCTIFITEDGKLYGCGRNNYGQLGNSTSTQVSTPIQIGADLGKIVFFEATSGDTFFITEDGKLYGCGHNGSGQLGNGTNTTPVTTPIQIGDTLDTKVIGAYFSSSTVSATTIFLTEDGKAYGCGSNGSGQLGNGTNTNSNVPVQIGADLGKIIDIMHCKFSTYLILEDGSLYGCGANTYGQLGIGTNSNVNTPTQIGADLGKATLGTGDYKNGEETFSIIFETSVESVNFETNNAEYGSVSKTSATVIEGSTIGISDNTVTIGSATVTATPTANSAQYSYAFDSWTGATDGQTVVDGMTITANFSRTLNTYAVTVTDDGTGYGSVSGDTFPNEAYGSRILIGGNTLSINGDTVTATPLDNTDNYTYTFLGWFVGDVRLNNNEVVTGTMEITAKFERTVNTYPITWVVDGKQTVQMLEYGTTPAIEDPVKPGYYFTGWEPAIETVTGAATYTAQFTAANFAVYLNDGNGHGGPAGLFYYSATDETHTFTIPDDAPTWIMHEFMGWSETNGGEVAYSAGDEITVNVDEPVTLYAVWERESGSGSVIGTMIDIIPLLIIVGLILGLVAAFLYFRTG